MTSCQSLWQGLYDGQRFWAKKGIDFDEVFSPTIEVIYICIILGLAASMDLELKQLEVKIAFLHSDLEEEIYMEQPKGFEHGLQPKGFKVKSKEDMVCKLKKSLWLEASAKSMV